MGTNNGSKWRDGGDVLSHNFRFLMSLKSPLHQEHHFTDILVTVGREIVKVHEAWMPKALSWAVPTHHWYFSLPSLPFHPTTLLLFSLFICYSLLIVLFIFIWRCRIPSQRPFISPCIKCPINWEQFFSLWAEFVQCPAKRKVWISDSIWLLYTRGTGCTNLYLIF